MTFTEAEAGVVKAYERHRLSYSRDGASSHHCYCCCDGVRLRLRGTGPLTGVLPILQMICEWIGSICGIIFDMGAQKDWRRTCPSAIWSTKNPTWNDLRANPDLRLEKPATNRLSYGTAKFTLILLSSLHRSTWPSTIWKNLCSKRLIMPFCFHKNM
jgi:hypothetical protein